MWGMQKEEDGEAVGQGGEEDHQIPICTRKACREQNPLSLEAARPLYAAIVVYLLWSPPKQFIHRSDHTTTQSHVLVR